VYGALAAIPIFLLWMYISWSAVLFGGVVAAGLPQWRVDEGVPKVPYEGRQLGLCLALLSALAAKSRRGGSLTTAALAEALGVTASAVDDHLCPLQDAGFVAATADGGWVLARAPASASVFDLYKALDLPFAGAWREREAEAPWQRRVAAAMTRVAAAESAAMRIPLAALLDEEQTNAAEATPLPRPRVKPGKPSAI
jgi:membrane protein